MCGGGAVTNEFISNIVKIWGIFRKFVKDFRTKVVGQQHWDLFRSVDKTRKNLEVTLCDEAIEVLSY